MIFPPYTISQTYLSLDMLNGDIDNLPPNTTHLRFCIVIWSNVVRLMQFAENCPFLSHIMLDCVFDDMDVVDEFADGLPELMDTLQERKHIDIVPRIRSDDLGETALCDIEVSPKQYHPQLIPVDSALRRAHSMFWSAHVSDEGVKRPDSFFSLVNYGKIKLVAPRRVASFSSDGSGVILDDGTTVKAGALVLATGYSSSWTGLFQEETIISLGLERHPPKHTSETNEWDYPSLSEPPSAHPEQEQWAASIYRGIVPVKNISKQDFAINGAVFTTNNGYTFEVIAHWISAYFKRELCKLPPPEQALAEAERNARFMRKRFPDQLLWLNESSGSSIELFSWPQYVDTLLDDLGLRSLRSGGNWLTWPFKVVDLKELESLKEERDALRRRKNAG